MQSIKLRQLTYDSFVKYKDQNKYKDDSDAMDNLLKRSVFQRRKSKPRTCCRSCCKMIFRLLILVIGLWLATQICFLFFFSRLQTSFPDPANKRVLFFADPQIEGNSRVKREGVFGIIQNMYNDYYMKWIFNMDVIQTKPDMIVVLGDLVSSQLIKYEEFQQRVIRLKWIFELPPGYEDIKFVWLAGNHDIGYGSDCNLKRLRRFEDAFGKQDRYFEYLGHNWLMFNSQLVEGVKEESLRNRTSIFLENHGNEYLMSKAFPDHKPLIVLDHIPFYKSSGNCVDSPSIKFDKDGYILSQNMLSLKTTTDILKFGPIFIFNGHDHNGCFYEHRMTSPPHVQEVTVRSMMGDFGGHSLLFEIIPLDDSQIEEDTGRQEYKYEVFLISFFTTDEIIVKFIILLCWIAITVPTILFCCCGCCGCCRSKKVKTD